MNIYEEKEALQLRVNELEMQIGEYSETLNALRTAHSQLQRECERLERLLAISGAA